MLAPSSKCSIVHFVQVRRISPKMTLLTCAFLAFLCLFMVRHHQAAAMSMRTKAKDSRSDHISLSLWLIPPEETSEKLNKQMIQFARKKETGLTFVPHITLIGGISCQSDTDTLEVAKTLEKGLSGFGDILCEVTSVGSKPVWSQAVFFIVKRSEELMTLCKKARGLLGMEVENWDFAAPVSQPHLSLFYGEDNVPHITDVELLAPFYAYRIALWRTDPPTLDGVQDWKEISSFSIK